MTIAGNLWTDFDYTEWKEGARVTTMIATRAGEKRAAIGSVQAVRIANDKVWVIVALDDSGQVLSFRPDQLEREF